VACGHKANADVNAARNIAAGHGVTARGDRRVLARSVKREPHHAGPPRSHGSGNPGRSRPGGCQDKKWLSRAELRIYVQGSALGWPLGGNTSGWPVEPRSFCWLPPHGPGTSHVCHRRRGVRTAVSVRRCLRRHTPSVRLAAGTCLSHAPPDCAPRQESEPGTRPCRCPGRPCHRRS